MHIYGHRMCVLVSFKLACNPHKTLMKCIICFAKKAGIYLCDHFLLFYVVCADMMGGIVFHSCVVHSELKMHDAISSFNNKSDGYIAKVHYTLYGLPFYYIFIHALVIATLPFL